MIQRFVILGEVRGQGRPRACKRGKFAGVYKANIDRQYEDNIRSQIVQQNPVFIPAKTPVRLSLVFYMLRPQGHFNSKGGLKPWAFGLRPTTKPDLDNMEKAVKDACNSIVWHDDCQVVSCHKAKIYGDVGKIEIEVEAEA